MIHVTFIVLLCILTNAAEQMEWCSACQLHHKFTVPARLAQASSSARESIILQSIFHSRTACKHVGYTVKHFSISHSLTRLSVSPALQGIKKPNVLLYLETFVRRVSSQCFVDGSLRWQRHFEKLHGALFYLNASAAAGRPPGDIKTECHRC
ncbi:hypothetical protein C2E23DRAFT_593858 [Lenzites betulinus]|nr:hypothetical protein C2E23DRAFT_593858 [Lenzites betulinus]